MRAEFLLEEPSAEAALELLLPRMLPSEAEFNLHVFHGKPDLLNNLESRLRGYREWIPDDWRIVVLIDEDRQDCETLKRHLEAAAAAAGMVTKSMASSTGQFQVLNRLAIEELEAWFFGDVVAVRNAYPRVPASLGEQSRYRHPDAIKGGTSEALERELQRAGYYRAGLPKVEAAQTIAAHMDPARNRSHSFGVFLAGLRDLWS